MLNSKNLKVLVAPLDWGLGHATRCIPIIKGLSARGHTVAIAAEGIQKKLLQEEFPLLQFVDIPGYKVQYARQKQLFFAKIALQVPKILIQIKRENKWLDSYLKLHQTDVVIADNRFGLFSRHVYSVFITHQLYINTSLGKFVSQMITIFNYKFIKRFDSCWIPDFRKHSLAGMLSHPEKLPVIPIRYIGPLTRFKSLDLDSIENSLVIIISGPEPQRSSFETKLFKQLKYYNGKVVVVRGLPGSDELVFVGSNVVVHNHLSTGLLNKIICESEFVIARSGYSTIMDLVELGKKSILIPTPGQPEQEYLANYLAEKKIILAVPENTFDLQKCLEAAKRFDFAKPEKDESSFDQTLDELNDIVEKKNKNKVS